MTFDCFMIFNELDLLEIRLNILDPYVNFFVIGESQQTFSGKEKPRYFEENKERFAKWEEKIIHVLIDEGSFPNAFERAGHQKDSLRKVLEHLEEQKEISDLDLVYFGDIDEIWKPQQLIIRDDIVYNLKQLNYCYYLNNRSSEEWVGTVVGAWKTIRQQSFNHWRANHTHELPNGGWHFTNMGGADQIRKKLEAYDHQEFNNEFIKNDIERKIESGEDYVGRSHDWQGRPFEMWISEFDLPQFVIDNKDKYKNLWK